jgi:putative DNA primase/helicase
MLSNDKLTQNIQDLNSNGSSSSKSAPVERPEHISESHWYNMTVKREIDPTLISLNTRSGDAEEVNQVLNRKDIECDGIVLQGEEGCVQVRFDEHQKIGKSGEERRYLTPRKTQYEKENQICNYDAILPKLPDLNWVKDIEEIKARCTTVDNQPALILTEGLFKALKLWTHGYPAIAVPGVTMALKPFPRDKDNQPIRDKPKELVDNLDYLVEEGFTLINAFDADVQSKAGVIGEVKRISDVMEARGATLYEIAGKWQESEGKGADDLIQNKGIKYFESILNAASPPDKKAEKKDSKNSSSKKGKGQGKSKGSDKEDKPTPAKNEAVPIAKDIKELYKDQLVFLTNREVWFEYGVEQDGVWSQISNQYLQSKLIDLIPQLGDYSVKTPSDYLEVIKALQPQLYTKEMENPAPGTLLPFRNGVYNLQTKELLPHDPSYYFRSTLDRDFDPDASDWSNINDWLDFVTNGSNHLKEILICFAAACLRGMHDLQKFLYLTGPPNSGKGTYASLLMELLGFENVSLPDFAEFNGGRFEKIQIDGTWLALFDDVDKYTGKLQAFKSITGGRELSVEEKGEKGFKLKFTGMAMVVANEPVFYGSSAKGVARRAIEVPFNRKVATKDAYDLMPTFREELSAFLNYLIELDPEYVRYILKGQGKPAEVRLTHWKNRIRNDGLAAWINDRIIFEEGKSTRVSSKAEGVPGLYQDYVEYCPVIGLKAVKTLKNFSPDAVEVLQDLGFEGVQAKKTREGKLIEGVRLRDEVYDIDVPTLETQLERLAKQGDEGEGNESAQSHFSCDGSRDGSGDGSCDGSKPAALKDGDGCDGSEQIHTHNENKNCTASEKGTKPDTKSESTTTNGETLKAAALPLYDGQDFLEAEEPLAIVKGEGALTYEGETLVFHSFNPNNGTITLKRWDDELIEGILSQNCLRDTDEMREPIAKARSTVDSAELANAEVTD